VSGWVGARELHSDGGSVVAYRGMVDCFARTVKEEGFGALFKARCCWVQGSGVWGFGGRWPGNSAVQTLFKRAAAGPGGLGVWGLGAPWERAVVAYLGMVDCFARTVKEEGFGALFKARAAAGGS
jgi:hypothetical protein